MEVYGVVRSGVWSSYLVLVRQLTFTYGNKMPVLCYNVGEVEKRKHDLTKGTVR